MRFFFHRGSVRGEAVVERTGALKSDASCMLVEPFAADEDRGQLQPVGRLYYGASSLVCVPVSSPRNGPALGAQAGEWRLHEIMVDQGWISTHAPGDGNAIQHSP